MTHAGARLVLVGVAGYNRGDDAIAQALIDACSARYPGARITATVLRRGVVRPGSARELLLDRKTLRTHLALIRAIVTSDLVIIGGGSIIQDEHGSPLARGIMALYAEVALLCKLARRTFVTAPIGVDVLHSEFGRRVATFILRGAAQVTVRDVQSQQRAQALLPGRDVALGADPAIRLAGRPTPATLQPPRLVVAPAFEDNARADLPLLLADVIASFLLRHPSGRCQIVAMDERLAEDGGHAERIVQALPVALADRVEIRVPRTLNETLATLDDASALVAVRLHAMILSAGRMPVLCLSRGVKTDSIAHALAIPCIDLKKATRSEVGSAAARFFATPQEAEVDLTRARVRAEEAKFRAYLAALPSSTYTGASPTSSVSSEPSSTRSTFPIVS